MCIRNKQYIYITTFRNFAVVRWHHKSSWYMDLVVVVEKMDSFFFFLNSILFSFFRNKAVGVCIPLEIRAKVSFYPKSTKKKEKKTNGERKKATKTLRIYNTILHSFKAPVTLIWFDINYISHLFLSRLNFKLISTKSRIDRSIRCFVTVMRPFYVILIILNCGLFEQTTSWIFWLNYSMVTLNKRKRSIMGFDFVLLN